MTCSFKILVDSPTRAYLFHFNNHCPTLDYFSLFRQDTLHLAVVGRGDGVLHLHGGENGERLLCLHLLAIHAHTPRQLLRISERGERDAMLFLPVAIGERARLAHHAPGATRSPWTDGHPAMRVERRNLEGYPVSRCQSVLPALLDFGRDVVEGRRQQHRTRQRLFAPRPGSHEAMLLEKTRVCQPLLEGGVCGDIVQ